MPTRFQLFKQKFFNNFIMQREIKNVVVERNIKLLLKISFSLFLLCLLLMIFLAYCLNPQFPETEDYIFYSGAMSVFELFTFLFALCFSKIKKISRVFYNVPLIINFAGLEILCGLIFFYGTNPFSALIIFVCLATIIPLIFAIEPLYYVIVMIGMGVLMTPKLNDLYGITSVYNSIGYVVIMTALAMNRWFSVKRSIVHDIKTEEREKQIQQELEMAALVQKSFYQHNLSGVKDWNVAYYNNPMISLSGDLFDFYVRQNTLSGLCIFDVSGHGLASGLVTMMVKNTMEEEFYENEDVELDFTMRRINERVSVEKGNIENYLTGILLRFTNQNIEMVNAGHPLPIIYHAATDTCEYLNCNINDIQGAIGLADLNFDFKTLEINLEKHDRIILYTDGVTEAKNILNYEYGKERFLASAQNHRNLAPKDQITAIVADINQFMGKTPRTDDISIIVLEKL